MEILFVLGLIAVVVAAWLYYKSKPEDTLPEVPVEPETPVEPTPEVPVEPETPVEPTPEVPAEPAPEPVVEVKATVKKARKPKAAPVPVPEVVEPVKKVRKPRAKQA